MTDVTSAVNDLTSAGAAIVNDEWVGTGVFDRLMHAVNKNIETQYAKGRIKGDQYANVYLGAIQAVLAQSVQYTKVAEEVRILTNKT